MVLLDSISLDTMQSVPDFLASQSFWPFFEINEKMQNMKIWDLQYIFFSNEFKS